jgi:hypothetical protein
MYQYEAVEKAMDENGGYATLKYLYQHAPYVDGSEWGTKTPNASIRRIVRNRDRFFKIRPGLWALEERCGNLPSHIYNESADEDKQKENTHWHFQGLLAEVGNIQREETWIPSQDKNKQFLDKKLKDVRSLNRIPRFGYQDMVNRAQTIDVIWFNSRQMPDSFFEVEFSTDFQNSLHKFLDLRDFSTEFVIVAEKARKDQFDKRISQTGFAPIRDRVRFMTFNEVSRLHSVAEQSDGLTKFM